MTTLSLQADANETIPPEEVRAFRRAAIANGYPLIRVRSLDKAPLARGWLGGEDAAALLQVAPNALNTSLVLAGLRCIDVDVDEAELVSQIIEQVHLHLPLGALIRRRANSSRVAIFYRAAEGQPEKMVIEGRYGKIEVLGAGQQAVVHGLHPSGAALTWEGGRGPDTVSLGDVPAVSEQQIANFLEACAPLLGSDVASRPTLVPAVNELSVGLDEGGWFSALTPEEMRALVEACLNTLDNRISDPRDPWLRVLFAVADAERLGCPDARQLALEWSQRGASWTSEAEFDAAWESYQPKPGGTTVGTLLAAARDAGLDLSQWRDLALARCVAALPPSQRKPLKGGRYRPAEALQLMNSHYFVGTTDRETGIFRIKDNGSPVFVPPEQFKLEVANIIVDFANPVAGEKYWKEHPHRHQRELVFKPSATTEAGEHNLWQGYGVAPRQARRKVRSLLRHIWRVLCRWDKEEFKYVIRWLAWAVQNPDKHPGVVIVLKSRMQGTGKSTLGVVLLRIFGQHGALVDDKDRLLGRFNDWLEPICFILAEEVLWAGDHKAGDKLKSIITADTIQMERKFGGCRSIPNRLHVIMTTNHDHAVAAGVGDRRFVVLDVSDERAGDKAYFDHLYQDLEEGGTGEFLDLLLSVNLAGWHPRKDRRGDGTTTHERRQRLPMRAG